MQEHSVELQGGRTLAVAEFGAPDGAPVLLLTAAPGSRLLDPDPAATTEAGVRLLVVDRPGYGRSSPWATDAVPSWDALADHLVVALDALDVAKVSVVGWSNGGIGALALAACHPRRVLRVALAGTPAPDEAVAWIPEEFRAILAALREQPEAAMSILQQQMEPMAAAPDSALDGITGGRHDGELLSGAAGERLTAMLHEAFRQGAAGLAADVTATNVARWGFDLTDIHAPVNLWYGTNDALIPPAHGEYYAAKLERARLHRASGHGHLVLLSRWAAILQSFRAG